MFSFIDEVSSLCPDHLMASLDVESLFTNTPLNEVIDICIDDLFCDTDTIHMSRFSSLIKSGTDKLMVS